MFGLELVGQHGVIDLALLHIAMALRDDLRAGRADDAVYDESLARPWPFTSCAGTQQFLRVHNAFAADSPKRN